MYCHARDALLDRRILGGDNIALEPFFFVCFSGVESRRRFVEIDGRKNLKQRKKQRVRYEPEQTPSRSARLADRDREETGVGCLEVSRGPCCSLPGRGFVYMKSNVSPETSSRPPQAALRFFIPPSRVVGLFLRTVDLTMWFIEMCSRTHPPTYPFVYVILFCPRVQNETYILLEVIQRYPETFTEFSPSRRHGASSSTFCVSW